MSIADLGGKLKAFAKQPKSQLNNAVAAAAKSGQPQPVNITGLSAGGAIGGLTPAAQQTAIGRFAVDVKGSVSIDPKSGTPTLTATVTGEPNVQSYSPSNRNPVGEALTGIGRWGQSIEGGKDYTIYFYGSQDISAELK